MVQRFAPVSTMLLALPYGIASGYVTVTLGFQLSAAGASVADIAWLDALYFLPNTWKVALAPLVDTTWSARGWYAGSILLTVAALAACAATAAPAIPVSLGLAVLGLALAASVSHIALPRILAFVTPPARMGAVGGWLNAGGIGGSGLAGLGLMMARHVEGGWLPASTLAALCLLSAIPILFLPSPPREAGSSLPALARDVWGMARSRAGALALLICVLPINGVGQAALGSAVARHWSVSADAVALVNGVAGGLLAVPGCLLGGWLCDRFDRKAVYLAAGAAVAACALALAAAPRTEAQYLLWSCLSAVATGAVYTAFSAVALEACGTHAAGTKYTLLASVANVPITVSLRLLGWVAERDGVGAMLVASAGLALAGIAGFSVIAGVGRLVSGRLVEAR